MKDAPHLTIPCEHCGGHVEYPASAQGTEVPCPHCGWSIFLGLPEDDTPDTAETQPLPWLKWGGVLALVILLGAGYYLGKDYIGLGQEETDPPPPPSPEEILQKKMLDRGFAMSRVTMETTTGTSLTYGTGSITNKSPRQRFGLKVVLDVLDANETVIGEASDYRDTLAPGEAWEFKALILKSSATSAGLRDILEDQ